MPDATTGAESEVTTQALSLVSLLTPDTWLLSAAVLALSVLIWNKHWRSSLPLLSQRYSLSCACVCVCTRVCVYVCVCAHCCSHEILVPNKLLCIKKVKPPLSHVRSLQTNASTGGCSHEHLMPNERPCRAAWHWWTWNERSHAPLRLKRQRQRPRQVCFSVCVCVCVCV